MLQTLDTQWKDHLAAMDYLRQGIHLRGYAQKNPKQEYKREAFEMFSAMLDSIKQEVVGTLAKLQIQTPEQRRPGPRPRHPAPTSEFAVQARGVPRASTPSPRRPERRRPGQQATGGGATTSPSCATAARSGATSPAPAAPARSTSSATARRAESAP